MSFPQVRLQRYRSSPAIRRFVAETRLRAEDLIAPLFINESLTERVAIPQMPGVYHHTLESLIAEVRELTGAGVHNLFLFGIPSVKDPAGSAAFAEEGIVQRAIRLLKTEFPGVVLLVDCCLCAYTEDGHCGILKGMQFDQASTLQVLQNIALSYAAAGADIIAPSGMIDGMVGAIREGLDRAGFEMTAILSYAIKYASSFYSPFRGAVGGATPFEGERTHHQIASSQSREALREALLDIEEGADYLLVKPSLPYLDIVKTLKEKTLHPIAVYHTSGEYASLKIAAAAGILDEQAAFLEIFTSMKRAGADWIITYYAKEMAKRI